VAQRCKRGADCQLVHTSALAEKEHFAELAVDAVLRLKGSMNLDAIQIIKKAGGTIKVRHWTLDTSVAGSCQMLPQPSPAGRGSV
jgi:chaperonin GroEL (HSP60 family)